MELVNRLHRYVAFRFMSTFRYVTLELRGLFYILKAKSRLVHKISPHILTLKLFIIRFHILECFPSLFYFGSLVSTPQYFCKYNLIPHVILESFQTSTITFRPEYIACARFCLHSKSFLSYFGVLVDLVLHH